MEDSFPDIGSMSNEVLKALIAEDVQKLTDTHLGKSPDADGAR